jgi:CO/xanthine dehydrogenase FAD-binding subunit
MKPPPFEYYAPTTVAAALAHLNQYGYEAKPLAGGQSLIPTMNFRLAQPGVLIDLNPISELAYIRPNSDGGLRIGAMTRQREVERDPLVAERAPLIRETMPYIAHPQIRNRGTFGGSLAHADPAAELPAVATALNARFHARSQAGERWLPASEFFVSLFATALEPEELLVEIELPPLLPRTGWAFTEMARRHGDYALVGVAAVVTLDEWEQCRQARLVFLSVGDGPVEATQAAQLLLGQTPTAEAIRAAAETAAQADIAPNSDIHASADFRRHLARVLTQRVLTQAVERAKTFNV